MWLGNGKLWTDLVSLYAVDIIGGNNINQLELRAQTIREYLAEVNNLFSSRGYNEPVDFSRPDRAPALFYHNVKTWETEPNRRTHITPEFLSEFFTKANDDPTGLSFTSSMLDWTILGRFTGFRLGEYGQSTQQAIDFHETPNGNKIMKAFCRNDFAFFDKQGRRVSDPVNKEDLVHSVTITWRVQKNRRNGQKISWVANPSNPKLCPVKAAIRIYDRSIRLGLKSNQPMGAYLNEKKKRCYITGSKVRGLFRAIAKDIYPDITDAELSKFSAHMIRVTACVILQIADKPEHFIKTRLRWEGDSYKTYLRNTSVLAYKHLDANKESDLALAAYDLAQNLEAPSTLTQVTPPQLPIESAGTYSDTN